MATIEKLCEAVITAQDQRDSIKAKLDKADKAFGDAQGKLTAAMVDIGQDEASFGDKNFATKLKVSWKQNPAQKDAVLKLLKAEAPDVVKESVHASTLTKFMNERDAEFQDAGPQWWKSLRDGVQKIESTVLSITKKKGR